MIEILFDNGTYKNFSVAPADFRDLTDAMRCGKPYYMLTTTDGFEVLLAIQKIVSVVYKKAE